MKLYRIDYIPALAEYPCFQWDGTKSAAKLTHKSIIERHKNEVVKPEVTIKEVNVPTAKAELLSWLNAHVAGVNSTFEP